MINATFNDYDYQLLPKRQEQFDKYCKIIQWGRQHPTRFIEDFFKIQLSDHQKWISSIVHYKSHKLRETPKSFIY